MEIAFLADINENLLIFSFNRHRSQKSSTVYLRGGRVYFMEAVMVDAGGPDHLSVGVKIPGGRLERPISNKYLYIIPPGILAFLRKFSLTLKKFKQPTTLSNFVALPARSIRPIRRRSSM